MNKNKPEKTSIKKLFYFISVIPLLGILVFIIYKLSDQVYRQKQVDDEVALLENEISKLSSENEDLDELINYLKSNDFKEREAKDKLNLIKEGEELVLVKENEAEIQDDQKEEESNTEIVVNRPNYYYWWHYFFSIENN